MKLIHLMVSTMLIATLVAGAAAFSVPNLFGMPMLNSLKPQTTLVSPQEASMASNEPFTLSLSGNVYLDKIPISGAEVTVYLNGKNMGKTTAGDVYMFNVPGVRVGDTIRIDASYGGYSGSVSQVVKFKNMHLDAYIKTDRSFIRTALEMLPTSEDMQKSQQQTAQQSTPASTGNAGSSGTTTSSADANQLSSQIWGDTSKLINNFGNLGL